MRKIFLWIVFIILVGAVTLFSLLYITYGKQTLLFLMRSEPEIVMTYSKAILTTFVPKNTQLNIKDPNTVERPKSSLPPIEAKHMITNMSHSYQKLNNCGPVTASMVASTYGIIFDQFYAAAILKGGPSDKNVGPYEMVPFLKSQGLKAVYRLNGNADIIEQLVFRDIPVIVEQWLVKRGSDELVGHYRVVRGYDQKTKLFTTNDSFNGPNFVIPYSQFDQWWRPFNRTYIVAYKPEQESIVKEILQTDWDPVINAEDASIVAKSETVSIGDGYSYFNLGTAYSKLSKYVLSAEAYDLALEKVFPPLFLWYEFGPLEAYYRTGQYDKVFKLTDGVLGSAGEVEEARYYRGLSYEKQGMQVEAKIEQEKKLSANPRFIPPFE